eukprot:g16779.t1
MEKERESSSHDNVSDAVKSAREEEAVSRVIFQAGLMLELPIYATATACTYFHRFYKKLPLLDRADAYLTAQACLLLASKVEENPRRLR